MKNHDLDCKIKITLISEYNARAFVRYRKDYIVDLYHNDHIFNNTYYIIAVIQLFIKAKKTSYNRKETIWLSI